ncbi:MAG: hypothetical protein V3T30_00925 [Thermodesulfobacteriota bacterium]
MRTKILIAALLALSFTISGCDSQTKDTSKPELERESSKKIVKDYIHTMTTSKGKAQDLSDTMTKRARDMEGMVEE